MNQHLLRLLAVVGAASLWACTGTPPGSQDAGSDAGDLADSGEQTDGGAEPDGGLLPDAGLTDGGLTDAGMNDAGFDFDGGCERVTTTGDDAKRFIVVAHPYDDLGMQDDRYHVFSLDSDGGIANTGNSFHMGRSFGVPIHFTPDGRLGMVAQEDGTVGVFGLDANGVPTVIHAALSGAFYAGNVIISPTGKLAWVIDNSTENNGGGLYPLTIACDGKVTPHRRVVNANSGSAFTWVGGAGRGLYASKTALGSPASQLQRLDLRGPSPAVLGASMVFPDVDATVPMMTTTRDEAFALMPENGFAHGSRLGIARLDGAMMMLRPFAVLTVPNPAWVAMSPFGNAALVVSSDGADNFRRLTYDSSNTGMPFVLDVPMTYLFGKPELPFVAATVERGSLKGRVVVAEISALRQLQFTAAGDIVDVSKTSTGMGLDTLIGALGITP